MMKTITSIDQQLLKLEIQEQETLGKMPGSQTYNEIISQGIVWKKTLDNALMQLSALQSWLERTREEIIFIGCGSTHYLSLSAAKTWTYLTGQFARGIPSSEIWYYPAYTFSRLLPGMVAISRSGETTETKQALRVYKEKYQQESVIIGCYPDSTMLRESTYSLVAADARETSVAQTRSFSSMYLLAQSLAGVAASNQNFLDELLELPKIFTHLVSGYEGMVKEVGADPQYQHFVFLGSGVNYGLASEIMLKMKEMSMSVSEVFSFMEFRHGPMSTITDRSLVIGFISDNRKNEEMKVLAEMKGLGATTLAVIEDERDSSADYTIELKSGISEVARGAAYLPLLQLLSYYHAKNKGLDPDNPTNLNSVVYL